MSEWVREKVSEWKIFIKIFRTIVWVLFYFHRTIIYYLNLWKGYKITSLSFRQKSWFESLQLCCGFFSVGHFLTYISVPDKLYALFWIELGTGREILYPIVVVVLSSNWFFQGSNFQIKNINAILSGMFCGLKLKVKKQWFTSCFIQNRQLAEELLWLVLPLK